MGFITDSLCRAIRESGLSQAEIAKQSGVDQGQISRLLLGKRSITLETADRLASVLNWRGEVPEHILVQMTTSSRLRRQESSTNAWV